SKLPNSAQPGPQAYANLIPYALPNGNSDTMIFVRFRDARGRSLVTQAVPINATLAPVSAPAAVDAPAPTSTLTPTAAPSPTRTLIQTRTRTPNQARTRTPTHGANAGQTRPSPPTA